MRRSKKTLQPKYAVSFIFRFIIVIFSGAAMFGLLAIIFLNRNIGPTYSEGISALTRLQTQLPLILFITALVQAVVLCVIVSIMVLLWSHSVAGPIARFRKHLREFAQGKFPDNHFTFRETDQLHGLAHAFSEMAAAQREKSVHALSLLIEARKLLDEGETDKFKINLENLAKIYLQIKEIHFERKCGSAR